MHFLRIFHVSSYSKVYMHFLCTGWNCLSNPMTWDPVRLISLLDSGPSLLTELVWLGLVVPHSNTPFQLLPQICYAAGVCRPYQISNVSTNSVDVDGLM